MTDETPYYKQQWDETTCPCRTIGSWADLVTVATAYAETGIQFAFRGEADATWRLMPSLLRRAPATDARDLLIIEREAMRTFMAEAHLHLAAEHLPNKADLEFELELWSLMQHFGARTRLLDWTLSPFVAAYFAVEQLPGSDGVVSVVDFDAVQVGLNDRFTKFGAGLKDVRPTMFSPKAPDVGVFFWDQGTRRSARLVAQQGLVSVASNVATPHSKILEIATHLWTPQTYERLTATGIFPAERWIFPRSTKKGILRSLRSANIAAHSLFPGLDGLGRSVAEIVRIGNPKIVRRIRNNFDPSEDPD